MDRRAFFLAIPGLAWLAKRKLAEPLPAVSIPSVWLPDVLANQPTTVTTCTAVGSSETIYMGVASPGIEWTSSTVHTYGPYVKDAERWDFVLSVDSVVPQRMTPSAKKRKRK